MIHHFRLWGSTWEDTPQNVMGEANDLRKLVAN